MHLQGRWILGRRSVGAIGVPPVTQSTELQCMRLTRDQMITCPCPLSRPPGNPKECPCDGKHCSVVDLSVSYQLGSAATRWRVDTTLWGRAKTVAFVATLQNMRAPKTAYFVRAWRRCFSCLRNRSVLLDCQRLRTSACKSR